MNGRGVWVERDIVVVIVVASAAATTRWECWSVVDGGKAMVREWGDDRATRSAEGLPPYTAAKHMGSVILLLRMFWPLSRRTSTVPPPQHDRRY